MNVGGLPTRSRTPRSDCRISLAGPSPHPPEPELSLVSICASTLMGQVEIVITICLLYQHSQTLVTHSQWRRLQGEVTKGLARK
jgi:hypothetical protein